MNEKVGIFGGTFDPIHNGHLITIQFVKEKRKLDRIIFIPCNISPLKRDYKYSTAEHRLNMLNLSIEGIPHFECSDYEITKGDISFTYETILFYKKSFSVIELIIGFDNLQVFHKWYEPDKIIEHAKLIVMKRETDIPDVNNKYFKDAILINTPIIDISATKIRERVKNNLPINNLVPDKVKQYIFDNHLYQLP